MSLAPSTAIRGAHPALQPAYFTSSLFIEPLRADIADLLTQYKDALNSQGAAAESPFAVFKRLWVESGWKWVHLLVVEERARQRFLEIVEESFLAQIQSTDPFLSAGALFALYTFHSTQPSALFTIEHIKIPLDIHQTLLALPSRLLSPGSLKSQASYILSLLRPLLLLIPNSTHFPPLPHSTIVRAPAPTTLVRGRPTVQSRRQNYLVWLKRLAREVQELNAGDEDEESGGLTLPSAEAYVSSKEELLAALSAETGEEADALVEGALQTERRMREIEQWAMQEGKDVEGYDWEGKKVGLELVGRENA